MVAVVVVASASLAWRIHGGGEWLMVDGVEEEAY
jgi:hypothetical protein